MSATQTPTKPVDEILASIATLDLDPIKVKLLDEKEGPGWSRDHTDLMVREYLRFLHMAVKYPETTVVCSSEVDEVWHAHILDTYKYAEDCERVFGYFFHHFPYFGLRGEEDAANLQASFEESNALYLEEFGEVRPELDASKCNSCGSKSCGHGYPWCRTCSGVTGGVSPLQPNIRPVLA